MSRVLDRTYDNIGQLTEWGYPFRVDETRPASALVRCMGPEYMRLMRKRAKQAGVKILDHSPALELLVDDNGAVAGAAGICRQTGERWIVRCGCGRGRHRWLRVPRARRWAATSSPATAC